MVFFVFLLKLHNFFNFFLIFTNTRFYRKRKIRLTIIIKTITICKYIYSKPISLKITPIVFSRWYWYLTLPYLFLISIHPPETATRNTYCSDSPHLSADTQGMDCMEYYFAFYFCQTIIFQIMLYFIHHSRFGVAVNYDKI
jgi:hypothetical protein